MKQTTSKKINIIGTGSQAPYGIGEIIATVPMAHWRKIAKIIGRYYNAPSLEMADTHDAVNWQIDRDGNKAGLVVSREPQHL